MGNMQAAYRGGLAVCWASGVAANGPRFVFRLSRTRAGQDIFGV